MEPSLTALLPVRNVQSTLAAAAVELLDVLSDLTSRVELVVVDDCSVDSTIEVADELTGEYPQIRVVRHAEPLGRAAAVATGFRRSRGEVVLLPEEDCGLSVDEVRRLWQALDACDLVVGRSPPPGPRLLHAVHAAPDGGYVMARRPAFATVLHAVHDRDALVAELVERRLSWRAIELAQRIPATGAYRVATQARRLLGTRIDVPPASSSASPARPRKPSYLVRIKDFALGE